jgi:hypothetical protein
VATVCSMHWNIKIRNVLMRLYHRWLPHSQALSMCMLLAAACAAGNCTATGHLTTRWLTLTWILWAPMARWVAA